MRALLLFLYLCVLLLLQSAKATFSSFAARCFEGGRINRRNVSCVVRATNPRTVSAVDRYEFLNIQSTRLHPSTL